MKNIFRLLFLAAIFTSCEDVEPTIYNGSAEEGTFLSFSRSTYSLPIERDANGTLNIIVNSSTVSNVDRTYNVELIPNSSASAANPATYSFPGTVTIPAGSYQGVLVVTGSDLGLVDEESKRFQIRLTGITTEFIDQDVATINVFEVCPLEDDFLGLYQVTQMNPVWSFIGSTSIKEGVYELKVGETIYDRVFTTEVYPALNFGLDPWEFEISFRCDFVNLGSKHDTETLRCTGGPTFVFKPTANPEPYDTADDSEFFVTFTENAARACNQNPREVRYRFTKLN